MSRCTAVLWIDLDNFKEVNDTLGHRAGDALLRQVSTRLSDCVRHTDTVARIGGDEFTIVLNDVMNSADAERIAENILASLQVPFDIDERQAMVTASVGISLSPDHGRGVSTLVKNADIAMYEAKRLGKNTFRTYASQMGKDAREQLQITLQLRAALANSEFAIHYQPQLTLDRKLVGVEALLRWTNPQLGSVSPGVFIPIAEKTGCIVELGEWVLKQACLQNAAWQRAGHPPIRVAVNVSPLQLARRDFVQTVEDALRESGLTPEYLDLEITETAIMQGEDAARQLARLRALGISISIDDFGTGYSSLSHINSLPVNYVKIDQSFVRQLTAAGSNSLALIRAIVAMSHSMHLHVLAEGVETEGQMQLLKGAGCDLVQGYLLHKPMTSEKVEHLLTALRLSDSATDPVLENFPQLPALQPA